ncbi:MAG: DUF423 domain-containing protein [Pseudomonadales bacterium]
MAAARSFLLLGALYGASGVALGAFGAHGLKARISEAALATWSTAVTYQLTHALALLGVGIWLRFMQASAHSPAGTVITALGVAGWAMALGVVLFSGSLYALALGGPKLLGPVTPLGGLAFIAGWLALAVAALRLPGAA